MDVGEPIPAWFDTDQLTESWWEEREVEVGVVGEEEQAGFSLWGDQGRQ